MTINDDNIKLYKAALLEITDTASSDNDNEEFLLCSRNSCKINANRYCTETLKRKEKNLPVDTEGEGNHRPPETFRSSFFKEKVVKALNRMQ